MSLGNISRSDVQILLNLGYYVRGANWGENYMHLRKSEEVDQFEVYIGNTRTQSAECLKLLEETVDWDIYQIGTLDVKEAHELLKLGYNISRMSWISDAQDNLITTSLGCSRHLQVSDILGYDWFVPIDQKCQILGFGNKTVTPELVKLFKDTVYRKYDINLDSGTPSGGHTTSLSEQIVSNRDKFVVSTKDYPGVMMFDKPADTVESILADNEKYATRLEMATISCNLINKILHHMQLKNITIEELDKRVNFSEGSVVNILSRPEDISAHTLLKISNAINYNVVDLFQ